MKNYSASYTVQLVTKESDYLKKLLLPCDFDFVLIKHYVAINSR